MLPGQAVIMKFYNKVNIQIEHTSTLKLLKGEH